MDRGARTNRRRAAVVVLTLSLLSTGAVRSADATTRSTASVPGPTAVDTGDVAEQAASQVIVRLEPGADADEVLADLDVDPGDVVHRYGDDGFALRADDELRDRLADADEVADVEDDRVVAAFGEVPQSLERIHVPQAHAAGYTGNGSGGSVVRVAIVDTGIDLDHPQLKANIDAALGLDCTGTGSFDDDHGHGTHVAGTVAAVLDGASVVGVAPSARLVPIKVLSSSGGGTWAGVECGL